MLGQAYEVRLSFALKWGCHPAAILTLTMTSRASLVRQNGPVHLNADGLPVQNQFSWDKLADYIWIDQPV